MEITAEFSYFKFAAKFCNELDKNMNCVFSPLLAIEVTTCANAIKSIIPIPNESDDFNISTDNNIPMSSRMLSPKLKSVKGCNRACKIYINTEHYKLDQAEKQRVKDIFDVKVKNADFSDAVAAAARINKGVGKKTRRKLKNFMTDKDFDSDTNVILVNLLDFKRPFHFKFDPEKTEETIFNLNNNETVNVFLMSRTEKFFYKDSPDLDAQMVFLPFKNNETQMLVVLPKRVNGLNRVLEKLAEGYDVMAEVEQMSNIQDVRVKIPRFKIESEINLVEVLNKLGVTTIFDKAMQKIFIEVNEEGTEPKSNRMTGGVIPRWKPRPIEFTADHPHLIAIIYENIPIIWIAYRGRF